MSSWATLTNNLKNHLEILAEDGCDVPFFRGQSNRKWPLHCGLSRAINQVKKPKKTNLESILFYDFLSLSGPLLGRNADSWDVLFAMQHHGMPTRLLDWSTTFSAALYFALKPFLTQSLATTSEFSPCIWVLDPFNVNLQESNAQAISNPYTDISSTYQQMWIDDSAKLGGAVLAIYPPQHTYRQSSQRSVFTLHSDLDRPLEKIAPAALKRFDLTKAMIGDAVDFLRLAGVNEFSIFPDLDGLARHLCTEHITAPS